MRILIDSREQAPFTFPDYDVDPEPATLPAGDYSLAGFQDRTAIERNSLMHMIRQFYVWGEEVKRSMEWLIKRLIKVGARVSYHARRWYVHVASAFPLSHHYRAVLAWGP